MTHGGGPVHRHAGSMGSSTDPSRIFKGKIGAGHMGGEQVTVQNLDVVKVDPELNLIAVRGAIPGPKGGIVYPASTAKTIRREEGRGWHQRQPAEGFRTCQPAEGFCQKPVRKGEYDKCLKQTFIIWPASRSARSSSPRPSSASSPTRPSSMHVVKNHLANCRQGTQCALTRAEVSGGGSKPWRQKGTGHARQGSTRAPQWTHGGIVFAPKPRAYSYHHQQEGASRLALKSVLSAKAAAGNMLVVDGLDLDEIKTKTFAGLPGRCGRDGKAIVVTPEVNENVVKSARNIPGVVDHHRQHPQRL